MIWLAEGGGEQKAVMLSSWCIWARFPWVKNLCTWHDLLYSCLLRWKFRGVWNICQHFSTSLRDTYVDVRDLAGFVKFAVQGANYRERQSVCHKHTVPVTHILSLSHTERQHELHNRGYCENMKCAWKNGNVSINETFSGGWFVSSLTDGEIWRC